MPSMVKHASRVLVGVRVAAVLFTCVAFSVVADGAELHHEESADWCIFCWAFSFACTLLVLLVELFRLKGAPWNNLPITVACYACLLCLSASVIFPLFFLKGQVSRGKVRDHRIVATVFSCLAAVAYMGEVSLTKARPGEVAGYMATAPGLLKVCQTFVACVIFLLVSDPVTYDQHAALKWCLAVYCICFILSMAVVVLCVGECTGCLPDSFSKFMSADVLLLANDLLAAAMYLTATILWPVFQFDGRYGGSGRASSKTIAAAVFTALNFLLYLTDLAYTARLVFDNHSKKHQDNRKDDKGVSQSQLEPDDVITPD